ncbi:PhzF family phenazine biosynthesis protein [Psychroflexus lacisalsi]|uniref:PhzF family phenazine biosynthesis protein n=1 Tax=Psychroflexus lacisalsi TaxID=503928 RepID=A0ABN1K148_9FLAO|nr:PhzF family phenazine biosynthesis protein [Psychroflexus lacisalsi]MBZ9620773.1 PhzF family phenazine biosynthesis protein [Psychroflexus lacisalsi]
MSTIYQVDAFTDQMFKGNPAGVMLLKNEFLEEDLMQNIVKEMNVSEVAFVVPKENFFNIRFFTPKAEVPLCGHATLSAAHILYELNVVSKTESIIFKAPKDQLEISLTTDGYLMKFPEYTLNPISTSNWAEVLDLNIKQAFEVTNDWTMLVLETEDELQDFAPNASQLQSLGLGQSIFTAISALEERDIVCRCFVPNLNILEDPMTGSAHCALGVYWSKILSKNELKSEQISERKGQLKVEMKNDSVYILGQAKTVFKAEFYL